MIRKLVILGVFILFLIAVFTMPSVVEDYVYEKRDKADLEINKKFDAIFKHQDKFYFLIILMRLLEVKLYLYRVFLMF